MRTARLTCSSAILVYLLLSIPVLHAHEDKIELARKLNQQVVELFHEGKYSEAVSIAKQVLAIREEVLGQHHPDVAESLSNLAMINYTMGEYAPAEPMLKAALDIYEKALGPDHPHTALSLASLAELYRGMGEYARAEPMHKRALDIFEKALGPEHPHTATSINNLALLYRDMGDYARAETLYKRALGIYEKALGPAHPYTAASLNSLAGLYYSMGDYGRSETLYKRTLNIREKVLGPDHPHTATSLSSLAALYHTMGDHGRAETLYKRALGIYEKALGPDHPDIADSLANLAALYHTMGDYGRSETLYKRALNIREKVLGPDHPDVASSFKNLAFLYYTMGDHGRAETLYKRALDIEEKVLGPDHPYTANSLDNLGWLYNTMGDYARAETLYKRAMDIREKALGPDHPNTAASFASLAILYRAIGDYTRAEQLFKRNLAIREKVLGPDHPDTANSLHELALLYRYTGDYGRAKTLCKRALDIYEKALGPDHPYTATSLNQLAWLYGTLGDYSKVHSLNLRSQEIDEKFIDQVLAFTSEEQQNLFLRTRKAGLELALSLVAIHLGELPSVRKEALDMWLRRKGVSLAAQRRFQEALVYSDAPEAIEVFQELARVRSRLSQLTFAGPGARGAEAYRSMIAELEKEKADLESKLATLSQAYALKKNIERADSTRLAQTLPEKTALMEFVRINIFNFKAKGSERIWLPPRYITFVLHAGDGERVEMIDLGDAEEIDKTVALFKKELDHSKDKEAIKAVEASRRLHDLVFEPLKKSLGGVTEVFISPDGNLNLIPFEVLQGPDGRFLIEDYTFNYLAAGRDMLGFGEIKEQGGRALIMGDPDFDMGLEERSSTLRRLALKEEQEEGLFKRSTDMRGFWFSRLPGTRKEVEGIHALLGKDDSDIYTGKAALEEVLNTKGTPRILHLATHGFFLDDQHLTLPPDDFMQSRLSVVEAAPVATGKRVRTENPLLRSGIALAGANNALESEDPEKSDGIVTAEKILGLRLRGTDMVVLSACDTGIGEVRAGEGVYGLRSAFTQAGTRSLVMSMWPVPDLETKELMIEFYRNVLSGEMTRSQALRQAALKQKEIVLERYGTDNPLYWGGFVFMGEP